MPRGLLTAHGQCRDCHDAPMTWGLGLLVLIAVATGIV